MESSNGGSNGGVDGKLKDEYKRQLEQQVADNVGRATIMISYSWDYAIGDIVDTLAAYCEMNGLNERSTYVWIDFLCVNLHRIVELKQEERFRSTSSSNVNSNTDSNSNNKSKSKTNDNNDNSSSNNNTHLIDKQSIFANMDELRLTVQHRIQNIGHVLAIISPYHQPVYLTRLWCMYELSAAYNHLMIQTMIMMNSKKNNSKIDQQEMMKNFKLIMNDENFNFNMNSYNKDKVKNGNGSDNDNETNIKSKITIAIPPKQKELFLEQMRTNTIRTVQELYDIIYTQIHIQSPSCRTTVDEDRQMILDLIQLGQPQPLLPSSSSYLDTSNHGQRQQPSAGAALLLQQQQKDNESNRFLQRNDKYHGFHSSMKELMRNWVTHLILSTVEERRVAFLRRFGENNEKNEDQQDVDDNKTTRASNSSSSTEFIVARESLANFYNQVAYGFRKNEDFENALEVYEKSLYAKKGLVGLDLDTFFIEVDVEDVNGGSKGKSKSGNGGAADNNPPSVAEAVKATAAAIRGSSKTRLKKKMQNSGDNSNVYKLGTSKHKTATLSIATTYSSIATVLQKLNRLDEALLNLRKCLAIRQLMLSPNNLTIASTYNTIAEVLQARGSWVEALELNQACQVIYEAVLGKNHPSTATIYDSIASQLQSMGRLDEAMAMYQKALKIREVELVRYTEMPYFCLVSPYMGGTQLSHLSLFLSIFSPLLTVGISFTYCYIVWTYCITVGGYR